MATYIERMADLVASACGDLSPDENDKRLYRIYALLAFAKGETTTMEDVHDAWAAWRTDTFAAHPAIVPFDELSLDVQELDRPYLEAIHSACRRYEDG